MRLGKAVFRGALLALGAVALGGGVIGSIVSSGCNSDLVGGDPRDQGPGDPDLAPMCRTAADCRGQACVAGQCCAGVACGEVCCTGSAVCLFDRCVVPGVPCHTANDCTAGQYCEPSLGGSGADGGVRDGGASDGGIRDGGAADGGTQGGAVCTQPAPPAGRCLDLPPVCAVDGGTSAAGCVNACEYHPQAGPLDAVAKWTWGPKAATSPNFTDVWSTPTVGRVADSNCDGVVDENDPPNVIFVSGNVAPSNTPRDNGVLRVLDGRTGQEVWSLANVPGSKGFKGFSLAIGDIDGDKRLDILAVTGEGNVVLLDNKGKLLRTSDKAIPAAANDGWGGGLSVADMDHDGSPEISFGQYLYTTKGGGITQRFVGAGGSGGGANQQISVFADMDGAADGNQELVTGQTVYKTDGTMLWNRTDLTDGFPAVGDLNKDGKPEIVMVDAGQAWILEGLTGKTLLGPVKLGGNGTGGPPTIADFDGDGRPEIGVAQQDYYTVLKPDFTRGLVSVLWAVPNHDLSSSVTGSSVFDFEGDGRSEVIYGDECFLWVFEGQTGKVRFATPHTSFTATEASVVADVDGDGRAEILMVSNGADPSSAGWKCDVAPWNQADPARGRPAWVKPSYGPAYRGLVAFGDRANGWVGTRTLWNQHAYHVTNICDSRDSACGAPNVYGAIPKNERSNWAVSWLNNYRQNVQDKGLFDAPDAVPGLTVECTSPVVLRPVVRNLGQASLPAGVEVRVYKRVGGTDTLLGSAKSTRALAPGQAEQLTVAPAAGAATKLDSFVAKIYVDPANRTFRECREDNNQSAVVRSNCLE